MKAQRTSIAALMLLASSPTCLVQAATKNWIAGSGNWSTPENWSPAGAPFVGDIASITPTDGAARTITYDVDSPGLFITYVDLTGPGTNRTTFEMSGNTLSTEALGVGFNGRATFNHSAGFVNLINAGLDMAVGEHAGSDGIYNLSGTGNLFVAHDLFVSRYASSNGTFNQTGGGHLVRNNLSIGTAAGATGTYALSAGLVEVQGDEYVGYSGTGTFNQSGGTNLISNFLSFFSVGEEPGSSGAYNLSGGALSVTGNERIGYQGTGSFVQTGGTNTAGNYIWVGSNLAAGAGVGTYTLSGGTATSGNQTYVGGSGGTGVFNVSGTGVLNVGAVLEIQDGGTVNLSGGTINAAALDTFGVPSRLNWTGGKLNLTASVTWDSAANSNSTSAALGPALALGNNQTLMVTGDETLGGVGTFALTLNSGSTHEVTGTLTIAPNGTLSQQPGSTLSATAIVQAGGTVDGTLVNQDTFEYQSGLFNGRLHNQGTVAFGAGVTVGNGIQNDTSMIVSLGQTLTVNGAGLDNQGTFALASGTVGGAGPLVNNGLLTGHGTLAGSGGFTNNGSTTVSGGTLTLSNTGTNTNNGQIYLPGGQHLSLTGGNLANTNTINLSGGTVSDTATLNNSTGIVSGYGTISSPLVNGGSLLVDGGILNVTSAFTNSGDVLLDGDVATLSGAGAITNTGLIRGEGVVNKDVDNNAGGEIRAEAGKRIKLAGANGANAGQINLQGGTAEFSQALTNAATGQIIGRGTIMVGGAGLSNQGHVALSSGISDVFGDVMNNTGVATRGISVSGNADVTFWDDVTNVAGSLFRVSAGSSATFFGIFAGAGISGTGDVYFEADVTPGASPGLAQFGGNVSLGATADLVIELGGLVPGSEHDALEVAGQLTLDGTLDVQLLDGFTPAAGQSFDVLDWGMLDGQFADLDLEPIAGLTWDTSQLYTDGILRLAAAGLPGDYNQNGTVDAADYTTWRDHLGQTFTLENENPNAATPGVVDAEDYAFWKTNFGATLGSGGVTQASDAAVPEPNCLMLLVVAGILVVQWAVRPARARKLLTRRSPK